MQHVSDCKTFFLIGEAVGKQGLSCFDDESARWYTLMEGNLALSSKIKYEHIH